MADAEELGEQRDGKQGTPVEPVGGGDDAFEESQTSNIPSKHVSSPVNDDGSRTAFPAEFIRRIPKVDLHVHLDGSVRIATIIEISQQENLFLPDFTEEGLKEKVFKESYESLEDYLECFKYTTQCMQKPEHLERVAYEFGVDNYDEGVLYFEVRFAPQLHANRDMDVETVLISVNKGLLRAKAEYNAKEEVTSGELPPHEYGIIVCGMRFFNGEFSEYYKDFCTLHKHEPPARLYGLASMALVTTSIAVKNKNSVPIVALDIAGPENGFPAEQHKDAYRYAHKHFLNKTVHAGEGFGPESIFQAVTDLNAERIGHGLHLFDEKKIADPDALNMPPRRYVAGLAQYLAEHRITLEVCLSSNAQTVPELRNNLAAHPFRTMLAERLSLTLNTDNRLVSRTTMCRELSLAADAFDLSAKEMKDIAITGFKRSFFPRDYIFKRQYVRQVMDYYDKIEREYGLDKQTRSAGRIRHDSFSGL